MWPILPADQNLKRGKPNRPVGRYMDMRKSVKILTLALMCPIAWLMRGLSGGLWRTFCLAYTRAQLGAEAVPLSNQILGLLDIEGTRRIRIGESCRLYKRVRLETRDDGEIVLGDHVVLSPGTVIVAHEKVVIEDQAIIGEYCSIRDQDHLMAGDQPIRYSGYVTGPVAIGQGAWIGRGCVILKGVTIGRQAVVGANSVVTRDVPPGEIWAGAPAGFIRKRETNHGDSETQRK